MSANCWRTSSIGRSIDPDDVTVMVRAMANPPSIGGLRMARAGRIRRRQRAAVYSRIPGVTGPLGIDVHAHFFPERFIRAIETAGGPSGGGVDRSSPIGPTIVTKGQRTAPLEARYWDLPKRVASMNRQGVAVQALSLTAPMVNWAEGELGARLAREWNDGAC